MLTNPNTEYRAAFIDNFDTEAILARSDQSTVAHIPSAAFSLTHLPRTVSGIDNYGRRFWARVVNTSGNNNLLSLELDDILCESIPTSVPSTTIYTHIREISVDFSPRTFRRFSSPERLGAMIGPLNIFDTGVSQISGHQRGTLSATSASGQLTTSRLSENVEAELRQDLIILGHEAATFTVTLHDHPSVDLYMAIQIVRALCAAIALGSAPDIPQVLQIRACFLDVEGREHSAEISSTSIGAMSTGSSLCANWRPVVTPDFQTLGGANGTADLLAFLIDRPYLVEIIFRYLHGDLGNAMTRISDLAVGWEHLAQERTHLRQIAM